MNRGAWTWKQKQKQRENRTVDTIQLSRHSSRRYYSLQDNDTTLSSFEFTHRPCPGCTHIFFPFFARLAVALDHWLQACPQSPPNWGVSSRNSLHCCSSGRLSQLTDLPACLFVSLSLLLKLCPPQATWSQQSTRWTGSVTQCARIYGLRVRHTMYQAPLV